MQGEMERNPSVSTPPSMRRLVAETRVVPIKAILTLGRTAVGQAPAVLGASRPRTPCRLGNLRHSRFGNLRYLRARPCGRSAGFQACCVADFQVGRRPSYRGRSKNLRPAPWELVGKSADMPGASRPRTPCRFGNLRHSRFGNLRYGRARPCARSAGFQACCVADFQVGRRPSYRGRSKNLRPARREQVGECAVRPDACRTSK